MFLNPRHENALSNTSGGEPMALGSPSSSPSGLVSGASSQYLPNYLMGDLSSGVSSSSSRIWGMTSSPPKPRSVGFLPASQSTPSSNIPMQFKATPTGTTEAQTSSSIRISRSQGVKAGGPPVQGLFDSLSSPANASVNSLASTQPNVTSPYSDSWKQTSVTSTGLTHPSKSMVSPAQIDPFYTQGESFAPGEELDESWVTVFGFPPAAASYILQQFSQYGTIIEHKMCPNGNWMHIHYQSKLQAKKALSKNGKVFGNSIMVGVQPCIDKQVMDESSKENSALGSSMHQKQPDSPKLGTKFSKIRPLTQSYKAASSDHEVVSPTRTPQKKNDFLSTAMEYVFGW